MKNKDKKLYISTPIYYANDKPHIGHAYTTILAMMRKMDAKGYLEHDVEGRTFVYRAAISQNDVRQNVLSDILERLFDGSPALMVNSLVEQKGISEEDLEQIKEITREAKKNK